MCLCNLHIHTGLIPSVVTSVWQHVTRPLTHTHTHIHAHSSVPDCKAPRLSAGSSGYGRPAGQTLWKPLSHTHSPPPQGSGGGIGLPVQRRPGLALAAACDLGCLCMDVCFISHSLRVSAHSAAVSSRYVGVIYSVDCRRFKLMRTNAKSDLFLCSKALGIVYTALHSPMCNKKR